MKALCLNIDSDTESWRLSQEQFDNVGLKVERFSATVEDNRVLAFNKSVYRAMKECVKFRQGEFDQDSYEDLLLFEDDVVFDWHLFPPWVFNESAMNELNCMTLHFGGNIIGSDNYNLASIYGQPQQSQFRRDVVRIFGAWQTHAVYYSAECVKYILDNFKFVTDEYKTEGVEIFDDWLTRNVMVQGRSYMLNPMIAYQRPRKSEIWGHHADYVGAHKQGNEYLKNIV